MLEQRVLLNPCSWDTYERLASEHVDRLSPRFTYTEGALEIMSPSLEHEKLNEAIKLIVSLACEELDIEVEPLGSTTLRRADAQQGVEPDSSFYFHVTDRDPAVDPPDLMVEIEISRSVMDKLPLFAKLGVREVWRCGVQGVTILLLSGDEYLEAPRSCVLPLDAAGLTNQLAERKRLGQNVWLRGLRAWVRASATGLGS